MDENNKSQIDSILSFVAGKSPQSESSLRERGTNDTYSLLLEASSWLLMATDLLPFPSLQGSFPETGLTNGRHFSLMYYSR